MCQNKKQRHYVLHNYHDHAFDQDAEGSGMVSDGDNFSSDEEEKRVKQQNKRRGPRGGVTVPFPDKLHSMLSRAEVDGHAHIVSWQPHGRCFLLHKPKEFVTEVMPMFFKQSKLTSFQRQLNLYGFSRLTSGPDRGAYYHELFLRGKEFLCKNMVRTRIKGTGIKGASSPSTEPNFYIMPPVPPSGQEVVSDTIKDDTPVPEEIKCTVPEQTQDMAVTAHVVWPEPDEDVLSAEIPLLTPSSATADTPPPPPVLVTPTVSPFQIMGLPPRLPSELLLNQSILPPPPPFHDHDEMSFEGQRFLFPPKLPSEKLLNQSIVPPPPPLHDHDEVFFEGQRFHYLDSSDLAAIKLPPAPFSSPDYCDSSGILTLDHDHVIDLEEDPDMFEF